MLLRIFKTLLMALEAMSAFHIVLVPIQLLSRAASVLPSLSFWKLE